MPKSDGNLSRKVLFKPQTNPAELGGTLLGGFAPTSSPHPVPDFWDGAMLLVKGRKIVGEKGQTPMEGCQCPREGQEDGQMLLGQVWAPKREGEQLALGKDI